MESKHTDHLKEASRTFAESVAAEVARNRWIASSVCGDIVNGADIRRIETEGLQALYDWVGVELARRDFEVTIDKEPF